MRLALFMSRRSKSKDDVWKYLIRVLLISAFVLLFWGIIKASGWIEYVADNVSSGVQDLEGCAKFEYLSSFIEIMIALNVAGLFDGVRKFFEKRRKAFVSDLVKDICKSRRGLVKDEVAKEVNLSAEPILKYMRKNSMFVFEGSRWMGLGTSIILSLLLLTNIPKNWRIYVFISVYPVALFLLATYLNHLLCKWRIKKVCLNVVVKDEPTDDGSVIAAIAETTGPKEVV